MDVAEARERLLQDGYVVVRELLSHDDVQMVKERLRHIAAHPDIFAQRGIELVADSGASDAAASDPLARYAQISHVLWRDRTCWDGVLAHPNMIRLASAMLGPDFYVNHGGTFLKPAHHGSAVPWHQDSTTWGVPLDAWSAADAPLIFDFWLALDPATRRNGCLELLPGSQALGLVPHESRGGLLIEADPERFGFPIAAAVAIEAGPGDIVVYHQDMFHGSAANRSGDPRVAAAGTLVAEVDIPLMRGLFPDLPTLERVPVCKGGVGVEFSSRR